jgi:flagella basal body P-ring formation protein FlgA
MIRTASLVLAAAALAAWPALADPTLRPAVTINAAAIHLGDLFADAGRHAGDVVAAAPAVGTHVTFHADWLAATAHEHQLSWSPRSAYDQATVDRASRAIGADAIAKRLMSEIAASQPVADAELQLDNPGLRLVVAADAPDTLAIDGLDIDQRTGRVSAFVSAPAGDPAAARQRVTGSLIHWVSLPVLDRPMAAGATIAAGDLETIKVRRDRAAPDAATDAAQLIGMTPRRPLQAEEPVRLGDVQRPVLVHRGDLVTLVLETATLRLTTQGKALEDGAINALVRVENTKSNRVIDAAVTGPGLVAVSMPGTPEIPAETASR